MEWVALLRRPMFSGLLGAEQFGVRAVGTHEFRMRALFRHAPAFERHHRSASAAFAMRCVTMITVLPQIGNA